MDYLETATPANPKAGRAKPFDGGPAYPVIAENGLGHISDGMSKREAFAMAAMQGMIGSGTVFGLDKVATVSVVMADALIAELEKHGPAPSDIAAGEIG